MQPNDALRTAKSASASLGAIVFAALVPKCPLCVAAMLSALGVGAAAAHRFAPFLRLGAFAVAAIVVSLAVVAEVRRARRPCCRRA